MWENYNDGLSGLAVLTKITSVTDGQTDKIGAADNALARASPGVKPWQIKIILPYDVNLANLVNTVGL